MIIFENVVSKENTKYGLESNTCVHCTVKLLLTVHGWNSALSNVTSFLDIILSFGDDIVDQADECECDGHPRK